MEIISIYFAVLSIVIFFIYYLLGPKLRMYYLVLLSCGFIASLSLNLMVYVLAYAMLNYLIGLRLTSSRYPKALFRTGIALNLVQLIFLKYYGFTVGPLLELFTSNPGVLDFTDLIIPVGVSFFTLQGIGYLINVRMNWEKPEKNYFHFLLYITFYPKFLSGPIERSNHFLPQLLSLKTFDAENIISGLRIALWGFFKKVIIANHLAAAIAQTYSSMDTSGGLNILLIILIQPLYLYFDFSGYTDIAIGFARTLGIDLLPNFNRPFMSESVTNLWRRMHMSLSFWFNDYIFKQTSFKLRKWGKYAAVTAVFITFTLFGIWHGAGWNFMILGFLQAVAINYEFFTKKWRMALFSKMPASIRIWSGRVFTYLFFGFSHIFFFSPDFNTAMASFSKLATQWSFTSGLFPPGPLRFGLFFAFLAMLFEVIQNDHGKIYNRISSFWSEHRLLRYIVYYAATILIVSQIGGGTSFIYEMF